MPGARRRAVTLLETLVVIAIITILMLLLLPAVNAVREMGRRTQCINNQRNLITAMIHYEVTHGTFPTAAPLCDERVYNSLGRETGISCIGPNWATQILGQIEEVDRYERLVGCVRDQWHAADDCAAAEIGLGRSIPAYMMCPSATGAILPHRSPRTELDGLAKGNYAVCLGSEHFRTAIEDRRLIQHDPDDGFQVGVVSLVTIPDFQRLTDLTHQGKITGQWRLGHGIGVPTSKIKDGTSRTIVVSEVLATNGIEGQPTDTSIDVRGAWTSATMGASTYTHKYGPNSRMSDRINGCDPQLPRDDPLFCEEAAATGPAAAETWASARSAHRGGVVAAMADGSVRFYADDIHLPIWQAYATRSGGDH